VHWHQPRSLRQAISWARTVGTSVAGGGPPRATRSECCFVGPG
jgi:hypothetical protein